MRNFTPFLVFLAIMSYSICQAQTPTIKWWFDLDDSAFGSAAAADIDDDQKLEIVFGCYRNDSSVYALNAENGSLLWKRNLAGDGEGCNDVAPVIADVDMDGKLDVVVPSSCNPRTFCFDGLSGEDKWVTLLHGSDSPPTVGDVDNDGKPEILHGNFGGSVSCLNGENGDIAWDLIVDPNSWIQTAPTLLDVDNNDQLDFVVSNSSFGNNHKIFCYRGDTQELLWESDLPNDWTYHGASFADLDEDNFMELVIGCYDGNIYCLNAEDGSEHWTYAFPNAFYTPMATSIADLNNDSKYEVVVFDYDQVGALSHTGELLWDFTIPAFGQSFRGAAISDINNDQVLDVVFGSTNGVLYALSGDDGDLIWDIDLAAHYGNPDFELDHGPVIADFDDDGLLDIFVVGGHTVFPDFQENYGRAYAISTNSPGGPDWLMFRRDTIRSARVPITMATSVESPPPSKPEFEVSPNPAFRKVQITYQLPEASNVLIEFLDISGRVVGQVFNGYVDAGRHNLLWTKINSLAPGTYFIRFNFNDQQLTKKLILME